MDGGTDGGDGAAGGSQTSVTPSDESATPETVALLEYLTELQGKKILFGHQDELLVGAKHKRSEIGGSDTYDMIQDYPALYGYDLANVEQPPPNNALNKMQLSFDNIKMEVESLYSKGAVVTLMWSINNPIDPTLNQRSTAVPDTITKLFEDSHPDGGPTYLSDYDGWLDILAGTLKGLTVNGVEVPILFRPFHECTGDWFWWGQGAGRSPDAEYIKLYRHTVDYLKSKGVHNLLYVYNTGNVGSEAAFLARYPGDDYVDVLSVDVYDYQRNYEDGGTPLEPGLQVLSAKVSAMAKARHKVSAIAETGFENMPQPTWWTSTLYPAITGSGVSYVMIWGNYGSKPDTYWGSFQGDPSEADFVEFSKKPDILFQSSLTNALVYH